MRKYIVAAANVVIIFVMMLIVTNYSYYSSIDKREAQIREFENLTVGMVQTTTNYLYGAQQVANSWGHYINSQFLTIDEAIDFLRKSKGEEPEINGQILYIDQKENSGLSTDADEQSPSDYEVHYIVDSLFPYSGEQSIVDRSGQINMTRIFTNQINGKQSVAFYHSVILRDPENGRARSAVVMYVIPVSSFDYNLKVSNSNFETMSSVIITKNGDYISRNSKFKNSNFFEFLNSYNNYDRQKLEQIKERVAEGHGTFSIENFQREPAHIAYASDDDENGFVVVSMLNDSDIREEKTDFNLSVTIGIGLLILFVFNIVNVMISNTHLNRAVKEAEKASLAKTEFLSTMSHDIRTPLNAILGFTAIAQKQKDKPEIVQQNLDKISQAGDHLLMLINDILDISQIENHGIELDNGTISIDELARTIQSIAEPIAREKKIRFLLDSENVEHRYVLGDQLRLNQVFVNLVGNAMKYTESGGEVDVRLEELSSENPDNVSLKVTIADTGVGISPDFLPRMYESFARQEDGRTSKVTGTGLGLSITKHLLDLMHGVIECSSEVGRGTTFTIYLDLPLAEAPKERHISGVNSKVAGTHVLVAEDNSMNWEIVSEMLNYLGVTCERAENGKEAIEMLEKNPDKFEVVFMDIRMPVMGGMEATQVIRANEDPRIRDIPIVALTADAFTENINECLKVGMDEHVSKPVNMDELSRVIQKMKGGA